MKLDHQNIESAPENPVSPLRVFVSYSHEDRQLAKRVVEILKRVKLLDKLKLWPIWDDDIQAGKAFSNEIKGLISRSHVFMPLITKHVGNRPWVHQETGYAMGLSIPVLPIAVGRLPGEMIAEYQAISVPDSLRGLERELEKVNFEHLVMTHPRPPATITVAERSEERIQLIAKYANQVTEMGDFARIRQSSVLSSFSVPDEDISHRTWKIRWGRHKRSAFYCELLREERRALEEHARKAGCSLIVNPYYPYHSFGPRARKARLETLLHFLESMKDEMVWVAIAQRADEGSVVTIGNWFVAESRIPRHAEGLLQNVFNWQGPTVIKWIKKLDDELYSHLRKADVEPHQSREWAIQRIKSILCRIHVSK
jgi:hypothetical protein